MTVELTDLLAPLEPELEAMRSVLAREQIGRAHV